MESIIAKINIELKKTNIYVISDLGNYIFDKLGEFALIYYPSGTRSGENSYYEFISHDEAFIIRIVVGDIRQILIDMLKYPNYYICLEKHGLEKFEPLNTEYSIYKLAGKVDNI